MGWGKHSVRCRDGKVRQYYNDLPNKKGKEMKYIMEIKPALAPKERHRIQDSLRQLGYHVSGGGTCTDMSSCDISFDDGDGSEQSKVGAILAAQVKATKAVLSTR